MAVADVDQAQQLWRLISLDSFNAPHYPTREALRLSVRNLWDHLWSQATRKSPEELFEAPSLVSAPSTLISRLVPDIDWTVTLAGLLEGRLTAPPPNGISGRGPLALIVPPFVGLQDAVAEWAATQEYAILQPPPTPDAILQNSYITEMKKALSEDSNVLVIPAWNVFSCATIKDLRWSVSWFTIYGSERQSIDAWSSAIAGPGQCYRILHRPNCSRRNA